MNKLFYFLFLQTPILKNNTTQQQKNKIKKANLRFWAMCTVYETGTEHKEVQTPHDFPKKFCLFYIYSYYFIWTHRNYEESPNTWEFSPFFLLSYLLNNKLEQNEFFEMLDCTCSQQVEKSYWNCTQGVALNTNSNC